MKNAPWAKLTMRRTPKIRVSPTAMRKRFIPREKALSTWVKRKAGLANTR